jgi:tetratricopeptide (TPR) repeat protein
MRFRENEIRSRMSVPRVESELSRLTISDPLGLLGCFVMRRGRLMELAAAAVTYNRMDHGLALEWPRRTLQLARTDGLERLDQYGENPVVLLGGMDTDTAEYKILRDRLDRCRKAYGSFVTSLVSLREGRMLEAVSRLGEAPSLCPLNGIYLHSLADYYIMLSRGLQASGRTDEAVAAARRAVELLPSSPRTFYNLASLEVTRDPVTAIALLERAIQLNPYYVPAYVLKAEAELASDRLKDAGETVGEILTMEPFNTIAHHLRGLVFTRRQMYAEARAEFLMVLEAEPDYVEAIEALAYNWFMEGDLDKAETLYERLLALRPDHLGALNNYATTLAEKGRYREAVQVWTRALELSPGNRDIIDNISEARQNMRR